MACFLRSSVERKEAAVPVSRARFRLLPLFAVHHASYARVLPGVAHRPVYQANDPEVGMVPGVRAPRAGGWSERLFYRRFKLYGCDFPSPYRKYPLSVPAVMIQFGDTHSENTGGVRTRHRSRAQ